MKRAVLIAVLLAIIFAGCAQQAEEKAPTPEKTTTPSETPEKLKAAFVYVSPIGDAGWSYAHDLGRKYIEEKYDVETAFTENVPEGPDAERVIREYAEQGYDIIFTTSFGYMDPTITVAKEYPNTVFMHCSGYKTAENVGTYFGRMYQARYLSGIVAGAMTETNKIGYVAAHPIPEVIRGINAFALGVKKANPDAKVIVVWTGTWYDPAKEKEAAISLLDQGCDVIAQHQDSPSPQQAAEERDAYSIGYNSDMSKFAPKAHLTAPVWNWGVIYGYVVENVRAGTWKSEEIWWGIDKGVVDLAPLSDAVPEDVKKIVMEEKDKYLKGEVPEQYPFVGPIVDQNGNVVKAEGEVMTDEELLSMNFFVDNVVGEIPQG
jgi:basic membrane protein A